MTQSPVPHVRSRPPTNGNITKDENRGIAEIKYNLLNLPQEIIFTASGRNVAYTYSADGTKLRTDAANSSATRAYAGAFEYDASGILVRIGLEEGQLIRTGVDSYQANYYLRDHLGM